MESLAKVHSRHKPLSLNYHRPSLPRPISSLCFKALTSSPPLKFSTIRASSSQKPSILQTLNPLASPLIKSTCIAVAALFFFRFQHNKPTAIAAPTVESTDESSPSTDDLFSIEEKELKIEQYLSENPDDTEALWSLMELKLKARKHAQAIEVIDRLIALEPNEFEWPLLKAQVHTYTGDFESAIKEFEEILQKDPIQIEAYHGLVMAYSDSGYKLKDLGKKIENAIENCKDKSDLRNLKLLIAEIRVMESKYLEALKVYEELVKEEPKDFRPYLCQGILYTLLEKKEEAEIQFDKFRELVPNDHPYREYSVDDNDMVTTKLFGKLNKS